ncbi:3-hydroxybutyrate oligomer hydrolase family protein [Cupriavidus sp. WS]|uniref:3-hydroxybutyrate oligomer hydrolase family protein n=1 Tax=Cupriavidus sp. WS TaxID=1312922 RepID=UPI000362B60B
MQRKHLAASPARHAGGAAHAVHVFPIGPAGNGGYGMSRESAVSLGGVARLALAGLACLALAACGGGGNGNGNNGGNASPNVKPSNIGTVTIKSYDGNTDDLLTAGLGKDGLASATAPLPLNPAAPTAAELRRYAIYTNYRALVDTTAGGGYGTLFGPNVDAQGNVTGGQGKVAGREYLAFSDDGSSRQNVTMLVQIPDSFDVTRPCLITATSSGSRGVYGGISTGEWALKRGCAVAYTDKGTGAAPHDLDADTVPLIDGTRAARGAAGANAQFAAPFPGTSLPAFNALAPHRLAFKHAHSQRNPEKDWGSFTLQAAQFALWALNDRFGTVAPDGTRQRTFSPQTVVVIASSVSNGGGAAIAAAEQDTEGLIDGVAVGEPNLNLPAGTGVTVTRGGTPVAASGRTLYDYITTANLLQLCTSQAAALVNAPAVNLYAQPAVALAQPALNRCQSLADAGIITGADTAAQAANALQALHDAGWEPESDEIHPSLALFEVASAVSVTFANALARAAVADRLCGYSFAATGAAVLTPAAIAPDVLNVLYATGNGVPPAASVQLINDNNPGGPLRDVYSKSPGNNVADANLDGARCLRALLGGTGGASPALQAGQAQTLRSGNLHGKPAIIVHGRSDALLPVNHTSRPYLGYNRLQEGSASRLSYIEVTNGQHFDSFIGAVAGYDNRFIPLHVYLNRALDAVYANLTVGTALPPSQVVRTVARGGTLSPAPALLSTNLPPFAAVPASADRIAVNGSTVEVPN